MRWEWRDMIRTRDWEALEALARTTPCQQLCDTVKELEQGLDEKQDVRRAKRILYFLKQGGLEPTIDQEDDLGYSPPTTSRYGLIGTTCDDGYSECVYVTSEKKRIRVLIAEINVVAGCIYFTASEWPWYEAGRIRCQLLNHRSEHRYLVLAPPDYCLQSIAANRRMLHEIKGKPLPESWREEIESSPDPEYKLWDSHSVVAATPDEVQSTWLMDPMSAKWRLFLHRNLHRKLSASLQKAESELKGDRLITARLEAIREHRSEWQTPRVYADSFWRHLDMAWAQKTRGNDELAARFRRVAHTLNEIRFCPDYFDKLEEATAERLHECREDLALGPGHRLFAEIVAA